MAFMEMKIKLKQIRQQAYYPKLIGNKLFFRAVGKVEVIPIADVPFIIHTGWKNIGEEDIIIHLHPQYASLGFKLEQNIITPNKEIVMRSIHNVSYPCVFKDGDIILFIDNVQDFTVQGFTYERQ